MCLSFKLCTLFYNAIDGSSHAYKTIYANVETACYSERPCERKERCPPSWHGFPEAENATFEFDASMIDTILSVSSARQNKLC